MYALMIELLHYLNILVSSTLGFFSISNLVDKCTFTQIHTCILQYIWMKPDSGGRKQISKLKVGEGGARLIKNPCQAAKKSLWLWLCLTLQKSGDSYPFPVQTPMK